MAVFKALTSIGISIKLTRLIPHSAIFSRNWQDCILKWSYLKICCVDFSAVSVLSSLCAAFFLDGQLSGSCGLISLLVRHKYHIWSEPGHNLEVE